MFWYATSSTNPLCDIAIIALIPSYLCHVYQGIVRALKQFQTKLIQYGVSIYVRRGGPNYQEGLRVMRELGKFLFTSC